MNSALMLHRHARPAVAGSYLAGAMSGAATTASGLLVLSGLLSPIPDDARMSVAVCLIALLGLHGTRVVCLPLPQRRYQIPRETFATEPTTAAFRFAFELGTGVRTYITSLSPYALAAVLVFRTPSLGLGGATAAAIAAAIGYGLGRSIVVGTQALRSSIAVDHPRRWLRAADAVALATAAVLSVTI